MNEILCSTGALLGRANNRNHKLLDEFVKKIHCDGYELMINGGYKDWQNLKTLHIGEGKIDFDRFFEFLHNVRCSEDFTIESTSFDQSGEVNFDKLNNTINSLRNYM